jgi:hypothetical protein
MEDGKMNPTTPTPTTTDTERFKKMTLEQIAWVIRQNWANLSVHAEPYVVAMDQLETIRDHYYADPGSDIVARFLCNAQSWRGDTAKMVKAELMGIATRATINAAVQTAIGFSNLFWNPAGAAANFTSAAIWTGVAAAAGGGALAIGAATKSSTGAGSSARSRGIDSPGAFSPAAADSKRDKEKEINVYVYLGDKYDRSAQLYMQRTAEGRAT